MMRNVWEKNRDWILFQCVFQVPMLILIAAAYYWDL